MLPALTLVMASFNMMQVAAMSQRVKQHGDDIRRLTYAIESLNSKIKT
jgi:hypothetical protein